VFLLYNYEIMLKRLAIAAVAFALAGDMIGQPQKAPDTEKSKAQKSQPAIHTAKGTDKHDDTNAHQSSTREKAARLYAAVKGSVVSAWHWARGHSADWWLVVVAFTTLFFLGWQAWETRRSVQSALRPNLTVRRVWLRRGTPIPTLGVPDAQPWKIEFYLANVGGSKARIRECDFSLTIFEHDLPPRTLVYAQQTVFKRFRLQPGEDREMSIEIGAALVAVLRLVGEEGLKQGYQNTDRLYFWGYAKYRDGLGVDRNISVCRHYHNASGKFNPVEDSDYDYAD
jgi:hypothetical protein